jgi:hypothetical protein
MGLHMGSQKIIIGPVGPSNLSAPTNPTYIRRPLPYPPPSLFLPSPPLYSLPFFHVAARSHLSPSTLPPHPSSSQSHRLPPLTPHSWQGAAAMRGAVVAAARVCSGDSSRLKRFGGRRPTSLSTRWRPATG